MTSPLDTDELRRLCENATPGPWRYAQLLDGIEARALFDANGYLFGRSDDLENGAFIAAARTALPQLLDENQRLRERNERLERVVTFIKRCYDATKYGEKEMCVFTLETMRKALDEGE